MVKGLRGSFPMTCDSKGRITLPASFRRILGDEVVLLPIDGRVYGFTPDGFDEWVESLFTSSDGSNTFDRHDAGDERLMLRLNADSVTLETDSAGRIALGKLDVARAGRREKYGVTGDVTVVGAGDHFEIWNTQTWNALVDKDDASGALVDLLHRKR